MFFCATAGAVNRIVKARAISEKRGVNASILLVASKFGWAVLLVYGPEKPFPIPLKIWFESLAGEF